MKNFKIEDWELKLLKNSEKQNYIRVSHALSKISTENASFNTENLNFQPIKNKIRNYIILKKIKLFTLIAIILSLLIDIIYLKNIEEWTNFSMAMSGFIIFIFKLWLDKVSFILFKSAALLSGILTNSFVLILLIIISLIALHFAAKNIHIIKKR